MRLAPLFVIAALAGTASATPDPKAPKAAAKADPKDAKPEDKPVVDDPLAKYFTALAAMKLVDIESGNLDSLKRELAIGEGLLRDAAFTNAAVALYAIVKSPRYSAFTDFVEYQNAEYDLGVMYNKGIGVAADPAQAAAWFRKSAEQGYAPGEYNLGLMYKRGAGVAQDFTQAASWFAKAAENGNPYAQYNLGVAYETGQGVAKDVKVAMSWYQKAGQQGNEDAERSIGRLTNQAAKP